MLREKLDAEALRKKEAHGENQEQRLLHFSIPCPPLQKEWLPIEPSILRDPPLSSVPPRWAFGSRSVSIWEDLNDYFAVSLFSG